MNDYKEWEKKVEENHKRNERFIKEFEKWLKDKELALKTQDKIMNLYLDNDYSK